MTTKELSNNLDTSSGGVISQDMIEEIGEFSQAALIDGKLRQKIQKMLHTVKEKSGFVDTDKMFGLFKRKHHMYYGVSFCEKC